MIIFIFDYSVGYFLNSVINHLVKIVKNAHQNLREPQVMSNHPKPKEFH